MNTYEIVTEKILSLLEEGVIPWRRPWTATGLPRNLVTKRPYRGVNFFLLSATNYVSPCWLTMRQANELGGQVRKGEHSQIVVFWKARQVDRVADDPENKPDSERLEAQDKNGRRLVLKFYRVFNVDQCDLPQTALDRLPAIETYQHDPIEAGERIMASMPNTPEIQYAGSKAFYSSITDRITLPCRELFTTAAEFYATAFHEMSHATGHPKRLNRPSITDAVPFGSPMYSAEELVAEMSAAYLCAEAGISPVVLENQAAYLQGWLAKLRGDKRIVVVAAAQAQRAANFILNRKNNI
jgi:antirestriction protein ArdC